MPYLFLLFLFAAHDFQLKMFRSIEEVMSMPGVGPGDVVESEIEACQLPIDSEEGLVHLNEQLGRGWDI